ncbi:MAG: hypothetical protein RBT63_04470 [Bdellovibrionales bacterium]|jgi:hypothetical protein|nr:hypothetical protein [Bdellovibrionales bacterium]
MSFLSQPSFRSFVLSSTALIALCAILTAPAASQAAPAKATKKADDTILGSSGGGAGLPDFIKGHLSVFGMFDLADGYEVSGGQKADAERAFVLGANYEFNQFTPGLALQGGATYDFSREVKNSNGLKVSEWTTYGELTAKVTPQLKAMGGLNYNFPSLSNAAPGATIKGKVGFQIGASFLLNEKFAFDGRYRVIEHELSGGGQTTSAKIQGFMFGGRYIF